MSNQYDTIECLYGPIDYPHDPIFPGGFGPFDGYNLGAAAATFLPDKWDVQCHQGYGSPTITYDIYYDPYDLLTITPETGPPHTVILATDIETGARIQMIFDRVTVPVGIARHIHGFAYPDGYTVNYGAYLAPGYVPTRYYNGTCGPFGYGVIDPSAEDGLQLYHGNLGSVNYRSSGVDERGVYSFPALLYNPLRFGGGFYLPSGTYIRGTLKVLSDDFNPVIWDTVTGSGQETIATDYYTAHTRRVPMDWSSIGPYGPVPPPAGPPVDDSRGGPTNLGRPTSYYARAAERKAADGSIQGITYWRSLRPVPRQLFLGEMNQVWDDGPIVFSDRAGDGSPRLAVDSREQLYLIFARTIAQAGDIGPLGAWQKRSDDEGKTWYLEEIVIEGGKHPAILGFSGGMIRAAVVPAGSGFQIKCRYQASGNPALGDVFTFSDGAGTPLSVQDDGFGLAKAVEGPDRLVLHVLMAGETASSDWFSADDGAHWQRIVES